MPYKVTKISKLLQGKLNEKEDAVHIPNSNMEAVSRLIQVEVVSPDKGKSIQF